VQQGFGNLLWALHIHAVGNPSQYYHVQQGPYVLNTSSCHYLFIASALVNDHASVENCHGYVLEQDPAHYWESHKQQYGVWANPPPFQIVSFLNKGKRLMLEVNQT
jgi:hypothetical protein